MEAIEAYDNVHSLSFQASGECQSKILRER